MEEYIIELIVSVVTAILAAYAAWKARRVEKKVDGHFATKKEK